MHKLPARGRARAPQSRLEDHRKSRGQSLVELTLVLPLVLLLLLFGVDFGRAFLGWVELNNVAREAANFAAEHPTAWSASDPDPVAQSQYMALVTNDAAGIDCTLPDPLPIPVFPNGKDHDNPVGTPVSVSISCTFKPITPVIGDVVGTSLQMTASAAFPIRYGVINGIPVAPVLPNTPTITTALAQTSGPVGSNVYDTATLSGTTATAGGTVHYTVYADSLCSTGARDAGTVAVTDGVVPNSNTMPFNTAGKYYWQAVYSGDLSNTGDTSVCTDETLTIGTPGPTIATVLSASTGIIGGSVYDTATLSGATPTAGGTVKYSVYTNNTCTAGKIDAGTVTVTGGVVPDSNPVTFNTAGTYYWQALYSGNSNNTPATSACTSETLVITSPMCVVPDLTKGTTDEAQATWQAAGFQLPVLFQPLNPPPASNITGQTVKKGDTLSCISTGVTVTWHK